VTLTSPIDEIISRCTHPTLVRGLFSATMPREVETMAKSFLKDPITVIIGEKNAGAETIDQR
jgi:ATP-dependent RNA helicase DDX52/ROK1